MSKQDNLRIKFEDGHGTMFISDPDHIMSYEIISDLYAAFRIILEEQKHLNVCCNFYRVGNTEIKCKFFLNTAYSQHQVDDDEYKKIFEETFPYWAEGFRSIVQSIIFDVLHGDNHTEEPRDAITERIYKYYLHGLKARRQIYNTSVQDKINKNRAEHKATDAKRKVPARTK